MAVATVSAHDNNDGWYRLSKKSDYSSFDTYYDQCNTLYVKVYAEKVDHNDIRNAYFEIRDFDNSGTKRVNLVNHHDRTYTGSISLSGAKTGWHEVKVKVEDRDKNKFEARKYISINSCSTPTTTTTTSTTTTTQPGGSTTTTSTTTTTLPPGQTSGLKVSVNRYVVLDDPNSGSAGSGFKTPQQADKTWGSDYWKGEATTFRAFATVFDSTGKAKPGASVTFRLKNPGGSTVTTSSATTNSDGIASFTYNLNEKRYYGNWMVEAETSDGGQTYNAQINIILNWWGCAWCHGEKSVNSKFGTWNNPSPFTMGYRFHQNPQKSDHEDLIAAGRCDFCHQVYDGPPQESRNKDEKKGGSATVYPAGKHNGKRQCEECHTGISSGRGTPVIPDCFNCHPILNQEVGTKSTTKNGKAFYGADETNGYMPNKAHSTDQGVPCIVCHNAMHNITKPDPSSGTSNAVTDSSQCKACHSPRTEHNNQVECRKCHTGDAHAIKFLSKTGVYTTDRGNAANCPECHQMSNIDGATGLNPPKIPRNFNHSIDPNAGSLWNETTPGYFGPWNVGGGDNLNACLYCHGETKHNNIALGRVNAGKQGGNTVNQPISTNSKWCGTCHYPNNPYYNDMMQGFDDAGLERPPDNTNEAWNPQFFDHTDTLATDDSDQNCRGCHGALLSNTAKMTEFVHNVDIGAGGSNCQDCHDIGQQAPRHVDISALDQGIHANLNKRPGDPGPTTDSTGGANAEAYACWACHQSDGNEPNNNMGDQFKKPWTCPDCHLSTGANYGRYASTPIVSQHFKAGSSIKAATDAATVVLSCIECHTKGEMLVSNNDGEMGTFDADGDGTKGGPNSPYHYGKRRTDLRVGAPTYTNCDYCHKNTSTAFASAMDKNASYHSQMPDHTDRPGSPNCADGCHGTGLIHDGSIYKPATTFNNNFCIGCHWGFGQREPHANGGPGQNSLYCADCHTDPFSNEKQIHGARYIKKDLTYGGPNDQNNPADCTSCHQQQGTVQKIGKDQVMPPQIPGDFAHSDKADAGMLWNRTTPGFNGPWMPKANNVRACLYCHGNKNPANTMVKKVIHNMTALGRANVAYMANGQVLNGTIDTNSFYCTTCHYTGNSDRAKIVSAFNADGWEEPVANNDPAGRPPGYFDHNGILQSGYSDAVCKGCHGALLSNNPKMDEFVHKVAVGAGGPDCISCHDVGQTGSPKHVDFNVAAQGVHKDLNGKPGDPGPTTSSDPSLSPNYKCWACHDMNGIEPEGMGDRFGTPWTCPDCHLQTGDNYNTYPSRPTVAEHFKNGEDIKAATDASTVVLSCKECHNKGEMILPNADPEDGSFDADGDGIFGGPQNYYHYGKQRTDIRIGTATNCDYCHQNTTTDFKSAMDVNPNYHSQMPDHTDRAIGPECFDCHGTGRLHDSQLLKPATMFSTQFCTQGCHFGVFGEIPKPHAAAGPNANNIICTDCHADAGSGEKQVHGIRYITKAGVYGPQWDESNAADCTTCHQGATVSSVNGNLPPKIPGNFSHSNAENAGMLWNRTTPGFNGPWLPASNNVRACLYCHGNKDPSMTMVRKVIHSDTALGRANIAYLDNGMVINGDIDSNSFYCSQCHYPGNSNRSKIVSAFNADGWEEPVDNADPAGRPPGYFDHSSTLAGNYPDSVCKTCHGSLIKSGAKMDEFVHSVAVGGGGSDCISCHDIGGTGSPKHVDFSVMAQGVHSQLNNRSGDPGPTADTSGDLSNNYRCWACHNTDGSEPEGMGDRFATPWTCPDCHLQTGDNYNTYPSRPTVKEHFKNGEDIKAATDASTVVLSCKECHNKGEMILPNADPEDGSFDADGDGIFGGPQNYYHYGKQRTDIRIGTATNCDYCHQNTTTDFKSAMDVNPNYHSQMPDHTDRVTGPECFDCHGTGRLHDGQLLKPATMFSTQFCTQGCHFGVFGTIPEPHAAAGPNANNIICTDCHADAGSAEKQVHGIRYVTKAGVYGPQWDESNAADCTTCHQGATVSDVNGNLPPKIPENLNHSQLSNAGMIWNKTTPGYLGPWQPKANNINACMYCHNNQNPGSTMVRKIIHNKTALGRVNNAYTGGSNINTQLTTNTFWCGSCHYPNNPFYNDMMNEFDGSSFERPPDNTASDVLFDHSFTLQFDNTDRKCSAGFCHGGSLSSGTSSFMDEFSHNVKRPA